MLGLDVFLKTALLDTDCVTEIRLGKRRGTGNFITPRILDIQENKRLENLALAAQQQGSLAGTGGHFLFGPPVLSQCGSIDEFLITW